MVHHQVPFIRQTVAKVVVETKKHIVFFTRNFLVISTLLKPGNIHSYRICITDNDKSNNKGRDSDSQMPNI